jgi:hypothetical protein
VLLFEVLFLHDSVPGGVVPGSALINISLWDSVPGLTGMVAGLTGIVAGLVVMVAGLVGMVAGLFDMVVGFAVMEAGLAGIVEGGLLDKV